MADAEQGDKYKSDLYTKDGTIDLKGRPFLRATGGRWTACSFIIASELFERLAYFGIAPNLVMYLTNQLHQGTVTSAKNVNDWLGTQMMLAILGACIADAYLGRYWTTMFFSAIYFLGMCLLTLTVSLPALKPPPCISSNTEECNNETKGFQIIIFFCALYIIALGVGGRKSNTFSLGANQFDIFEPKEKAQKHSFFNWWSFATFAGSLFSSIVIVYIQDNISWSLGFTLSTLALVFSIFIFIVGTPFYRQKKVSGSPFTSIARVLVSAARKWRASPPDNSMELHELDSDHYLKERKSKINHTEALRFLDKAAFKTGFDGPWRLCTVTQVEETKQIIKLLPVFFVTIFPSVMMAQVPTLFVKQGTALDRSLGPHFKIPPASLSSFFCVANLAATVIYDRWFTPTIRKLTKNPRGISMLQRIGIGLGMHIIIMIIAALIESWRLRIVRTNDLFYQSSTVPLTIFALLPQYALMGVAEVFVGVGKLELFYDQAPEGLKSLGSSLFTASYGIGNFLSSYLLKTTAKVTAKGGAKGWIENNLNTSHLDYYYGFLAVLNVINFIFFFVVAKYFVYNRETNMPVNDFMEADEAKVEAEQATTEELK